MTLKDYFDQLDDISPKSKFRNSVVNECGITLDTFYKWITGFTNGVPKLAKEKISQLTGIPVEELFPIVK